MVFYANVLHCKSLDTSDKLNYNLNVVIYVCESNRRLLQRVHVQTGSNNVCNMSFSQISEMKVRA